MVLFSINQKKRMSKIKKYGKYGKKILVGASRGIVAGMFLMGVSTPTFAETADYSVPSYSKVSNVSGMHMMHRWNSKTKVNSLVNQLGLDSEQIKNEIKSGKSLKQILHENGIETSALHKAFVKKEQKIKNRRWQ